MFFAGNIHQEKVNVREVAAVGETFSFQLQPDTAKKVKVLALVEEISPADWLGARVSVRLSSTAV